MHLFLYGPPGSGKSTAGRMLAERLQLPFIDLDRVIESNTGQSIPAIMQTGGEEAFRAVEAAALEQAVAGAESVVALGGGTLLRADGRALAEAQGTVICLTAHAGTLAARLTADSHVRPLLDGDLRANLDSLLERRREHYRSFPIAVNADVSLEEVVWRSQLAAGRFRLKAMGACDVIVRKAALGRLGELLAGRALLSPLIVTDEVIGRHYADAAMESLHGAGYTPLLLTIPPGESAKNLETVRKLWTGFLESGLDRHGTVIALGGGVVSDLAGFAASTYMRGVRWVVVPTTLLSMVDASLGGKTGFDLPEGKNLIGAFHAPALVVADPTLLATLPEEEFRSGLAEVLKHAVIADPELFELCARGPEVIKAELERVIQRAIAVKVKIIEEDPYEAGSRAALNAGHTVGHAVELVSGFSLRHGEAVAIGLVAEARLAEHLAVASPGLSAVIAGPLKTLGLPIQIPKDMPRAAIVQAMRLDKKRSNGALRFALPAAIGKVQVGVEVRDLEKVFEEA